MKIAFVDDTKQDGKRLGMGRLFALGAVAFNAEHLWCFDTIVREKMSALGIPDGAELKWSSEKGTYFREEGSSLLTACRELLLDQAALCGARAVVVVWDMSQRVESEDAVESKVLKYLYERVSGMMGKSPSTPAVLVFDKPGGDHRAEDRWIKGNTPLVRQGTEYVLPGSVVLPPLTAPSHHHTQLQLSDLVTGAVTAAVAGGNNGHAMRLMPKIRTILHQNGRGTIGGTGLKLSPHKLINLYRVVLAEDSYTKISLNAGFPLPFGQHPYAHEASSVPGQPHTEVAEHK